MESFMGEILFGVNFQSFLIFCCAFVAAWFFWRDKKKENLPPGPPRVPVLGSIPWLGADVREPLRKMTKKYGDIMTVYLGSRCTIMLNSYDVIKEAFVKHGHVFSGRPQDLLFIKEITEGYGIISVQGDFWKEQRQFSQAVLKHLGMGKSLIEEKIVEELSFFTEKLREMSASAFDPRNIIQMSVANVIGNVIWGKRRDYSDREFNQFLHMLRTNFTVVGNMGALTAFPFLRFLPGDMFKYKLMKRNTASIINLLQQWINEHEDVTPDGQHRDLIDAYLTKIREESSCQASTFTENQLMRVSGDLYGAGTETTASTLIWSIVYMLNYPDALHKVQAEIDEVLGTRKIPCMSDKHNMPYVEATIMEIQRVADIVPLGVPHSVMEDVELRGYTIPKGTTVMSNLYAVHRDERVWDEPDVFKPSRFLDEEGRVLRREELIPFSVGKRACLGEALARMELFLFFTTMFQHFTFELPPGEKPPSLVGRLSVTNDPPVFNIFA